MRKPTKVRMRRLNTAYEVVQALGGIDAVCKMIRVNPKAVYHYMGRVEMFPARTHDLMTKALKRRSYRAPARLWNQIAERDAA